MSGSSGSSVPVAMSADNASRRPALREPEDEREFQLVTLEKTRLDFEEGVINFIPNPVRKIENAPVPPKLCALLRRRRGFNAASMLK